MTNRTFTLVALALLTMAGCGTTQQMMTIEPPRHGPSTSSLGPGYPIPPLGYPVGNIYVPTGSRLMWTPSAPGPYPALAIMLLNPQGAFLGGGDWHGNGVGSMSQCASQISDAGQGFIVTAHTEVDPIVLVSVTMTPVGDGVRYIVALSNGGSLAHGELRILPDGKCPP